MSTKKLSEFNKIPSPISYESSNKIIKKSDGIWANTDEIHDKLDETFLRKIDTIDPLQGGTIVSDGEITLTVDYATSDKPGVTKISENDDITSDNTSVTPIYITNHIDYNIPRNITLWNSNTDYKIGDMVFSSNNNIYQALFNTGPNSMYGPNDPIDTTTSIIDEFPAGYIWNTYNNIPSTLDYYSICHTSDCSKILVTASSATNMYIYSIDSGISFITGTFPTIDKYNGIFCSKNGRFFVGGAINAPIYYSDDLINWTIANTSFFGGVTSFTENTTTNRLFCGLNNSNRNGYFGVSDDNGDSWTFKTMESGSPYTFYVMGYNPATNRIFSPSYNGQQLLYSLNDGETWSRSTSFNASHTWHKYAHNDDFSIFVIISTTDAISYSINGFNWNIVNLPLPYKCANVFFNSNIQKFCIPCIGYNDMFISDNGIDWEINHNMHQPMNLMYSNASMINPINNRYIYFDRFSKIGMYSDENPSYEMFSLWTPIHSSDIGSIKYKQLKTEDYVQLDGRLLLREKYPLLWAHAKNIGIVSDSSWISTQHLFSDGDMLTTFRIPNIPQTGVYPAYIKAK